jgi:hypothetical protein
MIVACEPILPLPRQPKTSREMVMAPVIYCFPAMESVVVQSNLNAKTQGPQSLLARSAHSRQKRYEWVPEESARS